MGTVSALMAANGSAIDRARAAQKRDFIFRLLIDVNSL
jgi:hypothetical protein